MTDYFSLTNNTDCFYYCSRNVENCDIQIISENGGAARRNSSMENVLDSYISSKAVPIVLRKRIMYERSFLI